MSRHRFVFTAVLFAFAIGIAGCTTDGEVTSTPPTSISTSSSTAGTAPTSTSPASTSATLTGVDALINNYCQFELHMTFTGSGEFTHPSWGKSLLAACLGESGAAAIITDPNGQVRWSKTTGIRPEWPAEHFATYAPLQPVSDSSGNLFIKYGITRGNETSAGIEVLAPNQAGADSVSVNPVEWKNISMNFEVDWIEMTQRPLFYPATADYDADGDAYRIHIPMGYQLPNAASKVLTFAWSGDRYAQVLGVNEWMLETGAVHGLAATTTWWANVTIADGHVYVITCDSLDMLMAQPTCTTGAGGAWINGVFEGELDGNTAVIPGWTLGPNTPIGWGILHLDAAGVPVSIERPEGTECTLINGEIYVDETGIGGPCPRHP